MFAKKSSESSARAKDTLHNALLDFPGAERPAGKHNTNAKTATDPLTARRPGAGPQPKVQPLPRQKDESMTSQPSKNPTPPTFRSEPVRQEQPARRDPVRRVEENTTRRLVVGREISLNGEISTCDCLVVEGTVEARVRDGRRIEVGESGLFRGTVEIEEADIAGFFEGDITTRGRLTIRATGSVTGKVQYGELEIEAGGCINGTLSSLNPASSEQWTQARPAIIKTVPPSAEQLQADLASETA